LRISARVGCLRVTAISASPRAGATPL